MFERVINQADHDFEKHLQRLQRYIQQPSVSAENREIDKMAELLRRSYVARR